MKIIRYLLFVLALLFFGFAFFRYLKKEPQQSTGTEVENEKLLTIVTMRDSVLNVGQRKLNIPVEAVFILYNKGDHDLIIKNVEPDCHCTIADYTKQPVQPGDSSVIVLKYDGKAPGAFQSSANITLNAEPSIRMLLFRGTMVE